MTTGVLKEKIIPVRLLLLDVDGVLTQGTIIYDGNGGEVKVFNVKDGLGLRLLMDAGIRTGIITGRSSGALTARCRNLGIDLVFDGVRDKVSVLDKVAADLGTGYHEIAFVGDDLPDIGVMKRVGCPFAVNNAVAEVRQQAIYTTDSNGGEGAVREICELILREKSMWDRIVEQFHA